ncbi:RagB/SusD family nutrient uptake outer membrane protein [Echinicola strongylocentroti]|uniref:RagB/SusD family nutrient uptake outer membrane protein n=1 Tax=Echinicola strongylocentroti TaxID=1795355 RepID=A0A2Z4IFH9_9BACT|nr:RagB/SusD family nutrient uptake outer membrane protein [Echinicola strongylocentroti]AWW29635.1 RagB/SusD family nutrient uptake outer membrane protein [Echinicola strongylocentroti]
MKRDTLNRRKYWKMPLTLLLVASGLGMLTGCNDLLEEEPKTVVAENFYQTAADLEAATNAIFTPLRKVRPEQVAVLSAHTDWGYGRGSRAQYNDFDGLNATNINTAAERWAQFYEGIRNANLVLFYAPQSDQVEEETRNRFLAEARFLRGLTYFDLVRNWGGVPLRTAENISEQNVPKATPGEVYDLILEDLLMAEENLPSQASQPGRPTAWAAKALLADVYLQLEDYDAASNKAAEVMDSGEFSLVPIQHEEDIQQKIFGPDLVTSTEEVFYLKYTRQSSQGNGLPWILNHPSTGLYNFGGAYAHYGDAANPFFEEWDDEDLRKQLWLPVDFGLGETTLVNGKFVERQAPDNTGAGNDLPIYRYAEVLLIYAEADARRAGSISSGALEAVNQVHRRAYGLDPVATSEVDYDLADMTVEAFLDVVLQEKAYELQFEGKRWLDLKRTGRAEEFVSKNKGVSIAERHYLWPIPVDELNYNTAMDASSDQNPGY